MSLSRLDGERSCTFIQTGSLRFRGSHRVGLEWAEAIVEALRVSDHTLQRPTDNYERILATGNRANQSEASSSERKWDT